MSGLVGAYFFHGIVNVAHVISVFGHLIGVLVAVAVQGGLMVWGLKFMRTKVKEKSATIN